MRQAYDYWQDQPGSYQEERRRRTTHPSCGHASPPSPSLAPGGGVHATAPPRRVAVPRDCAGSR
ncbi:MAG: hypothetical protein AAFU83_04765, partial [Bacteroidota bacterium]